MWSRIRYINKHADRSQEAGVSVKPAPLRRPGALVSADVYGAKIHQGYGKQADRSQETGVGMKPAPLRTPGALVSDDVYSSKIHQACGKLCGECPQIRAKWCGLWRFDGFEPRRSSCLNINGYLSLQALSQFYGFMLPKLCNGHYKMAIFHIGR
jgi:hypothetical protein